MKVRHKLSGQVYQNIDHYVVVGVGGTPTIVDADEFDVVEEPPPDPWQDVTGECEMHGEQLVHKTIGIRAMGDTGELLVHCNASNGYRLRKVRVNSYTSDQTAVYDPMWALIVERKVN